MSKITILIQSEISASIPIRLIASHLTENKIKISKTNTGIQNRFIPQQVATESSKAPH